MVAPCATVQIRLSNGVIREIGSAALGRVETSVNGEIRRFLNSLTLDDVRVEVTFEGNRVEDDCVAVVFITGEPCGRFRIEAGTDPEDLGNWIFHQVFENRDLLVTEELALALWTECGVADTNLNTAEMSHIREIATRGLLYGCAPSEPLRQYRQMRADGVEQELRMAAVETFYFEGPAAEISVLTPKAAQEWDFSKNEGEEIREQIFKLWGVAIPVLMLKPCETPLREEKGEFRLTLNSLTGSVTAAGMLDRAALKGRLIEELGRDLHLRFSIYELERTLGAFIEFFPMPVFNAIETIGTNTVLQVLRLLLEERVSIRDLRGILAALLELRGVITLDDPELVHFRPSDSRLVPRYPGVSDGPPTVAERADYVRVRMRDQLCQAYAPSDAGSLVACPVSRRIESRLKRVGSCPLTDVERHHLMAAVGSTLGEQGEGGPLLTSFPLRRLLRNVLHRRFPRLRVLCPQESSPYRSITLGPEIDCAFSD